MGKAFGAEGLKLLKKWEGLRLSAYLDAAGLPTIGYGHLIREGEKFPGPITEKEAEAILVKDLSWAVHALNHSPGVDKLNQNQFDALVCLIFNIGAAAWKQSTARRRLTCGLLDDIPDRMLVWNKVTINGKLCELPGLNNRRKAEVELYERSVAIK